MHHKAAPGLPQTLCEGDNTGCYLNTPSTCTQDTFLWLGRKAVLFSALPSPISLCTGNCLADSYFPVLICLGNL